MRGIAHLTASWAAAFALDPDGVTHTKTLGADRMARKLADALPGGHSSLRAALWEFLRPMRSPRLATLHRDTFVFDEPLETTVKLAAHRGESDLAHLGLGDDTEPATAYPTARPPASRPASTRDGRLPPPPPFAR